MMIHATVYKVNILFINTQQFIFKVRDNFLKYINA
jgi:hypothetical protein